jgi:hypothetical protein
VVAPALGARGLSVSLSSPESETQARSAVLVASAVVIAVVVPAATAAVWEKEAAAHAQHDQQWNQQCDSTKHFNIL